MSKHIPPSELVWFFAPIPQYIVFVFSFRDQIIADYVFQIEFAIKFEGDLLINKGYETVALVD